MKRLLAIAMLFSLSGQAGAKPIEILNASYDVSRELFEAVNPAFKEEWQRSSGQEVVIRQSHGGSSKQARSVAEGLSADVVTLNQFTDIDFLRKQGLVSSDWQSRFASNASPYYSLPVFLVRKGNPKRIKDWNDLVQSGVQVVIPNPKTSGNGRYSYLGAYIYALRNFGGDAAKAKEFARKFLAHVPVFDTGGRGATTTFVERGIGDVLITFESEVNSIRKEYAQSGLEQVIPSVSVRADFPVAVVDKVAVRRGTQAVAQAYLQYLYSEAGQEILAKNYFRVRNEKIAAKYAAAFPSVTLASIESELGGWEQVTKQHFADGALVDQLLADLYR